MRVAVVARAVFPLHGMGGLERHVSALVRHLVRRGLEPTLFVPPAPGAGATLEGARLEPISCRPFPWPRRKGWVILDRSTNYLAWSVKTARRILKGTFDVVHAEGGAGFGYAFERRSGAAPLVLQVHGLEEFKGSRLKRTGYLPLRWASRYAAHRAERVLVPDASRVDEVGALLGVSAPRAVVSSNAIDLEEIDRASSLDVSEKLGLPKDAAILLSVGRLESSKGFAVLVDALARCYKTEATAWVWVLVGRGPEETRLRRLVEAAGLSERVRLTGAVSDDELHALYRRAGLFVHPTLYEGSSLVTLEAMAHRKAVVASSVGGIPDKIEEGRSGFLVRPGDPEALAAAISRALSLGSALQEMGERGRQRVEQEFSWTGKARRLVAIYEELVSRR